MTLLLEKDSPERVETRKNVLKAYGAHGPVIDELLLYNENKFDHSALIDSVEFPLKSEPHVSAWKNYCAEALKIGAFPALKKRLVQLNFPIAHGISDVGEYRLATRRGLFSESINVGNDHGLPLKRPDALRLLIHQTLAGEIPVIIAGCRADFVNLVRALTFKNEPKPIPDSMGACMVAGYNNWDRIANLRKQWESNFELSGFNLTSASWSQEFRRIIPQKHLYQDRFIILSPGEYSAVSAEAIGLSEKEWLNLSLKIRLEHECTHYFTRRAFSCMQNNLLDEVIADFMGLVSATGTYRADWFLRFVGLECFPKYRSGGRLENYQGDPPLSDEAFPVLQALVYSAAKNLQQYQNLLNITFHHDHREGQLAHAIALITLTSLTLEELASEKALTLLREITESLRLNQVKDLKINNNKS